MITRFPGMVIWIILFLLNVNLFIAEFFVKTPSSVSRRKALLTFKTPLIAECLLKCKNTAGCKDIATVEDQNKKSFDCNLIASSEINHDVGEKRFLELNKLSLIAVSLFTLFFICESLKLREGFMSSKNARMGQLPRRVRLANILIKIDFKRAIFWNFQNK